MRMSCLWKTEPLGSEWFDRQVSMPVTFTRAECPSRRTSIRRLYDCSIRVDDGRVELRTLREAPSLRRRRYQRQR